MTRRTPCRYGSEGDVRAAVGPARAERSDEQSLQPSCDAASTSSCRRARRRRPAERISVKLIDSRDDRDLPAVARDGGRAPLAAARLERLALRLAADLEPRPQLFGDLDADLRDLLETTTAGARTAPGRTTRSRRAPSVRAVACTRFFSASPGTSPSERPAVNDGAEVSFETARDGQVFRVVAIAAADDPQHPKPDSPWLLALIRGILKGCDSRIPAAAPSSRLRKLGRSLRSRRYRAATEYTGRQRSACRDTPARFIISGSCTSRGGI